MPSKRTTAAATASAVVVTAFALFLLVGACERAHGARGRQHPARPSSPWWPAWSARSSPGGAAPGDAAGWFAMAVALVGWGAGQAYWSWSEIVAKAETPFPSARRRRLPDLPPRRGRRRRELSARYVVRSCPAAGGVRRADRRHGAVHPELGARPRAGLPGRRRHEVRLRRRAGLSDRRPGRDGSRLPVAQPDGRQSWAAGDPLGGPAGHGHRRQRFCLPVDVGQLPHRQHHRRRLGGRVPALRRGRRRGHRGCAPHPRVRRRHPQSRCSCRCFRSSAVAS